MPMFRGTLRSDTEAVSTDAIAYNTATNSVSTAEDQLCLRLKIEN